VLGVIELAKSFPNTNAIKFLDWFLYSDNTIDGQSKKKAYTLFESNLINEIEVGTTKGLQQIHAYLFGGLYDFAGQIRQKISRKVDLSLPQPQFLENTLQQIEKMPQNTFDEIVEKYVEMNIAHPFMGRQWQNHSHLVGYDVETKTKTLCGGTTGLMQTRSMTSSRTRSHHSTTRGR